MSEPSGLSISSVIGASGPFGWLVLLLAALVLWLTVASFRARSAREPLIAVALSLGVLLLGLFGTLLGWITSPSHWTATTPPSLEDYGRILWYMTQDLLPLLFAVLLGGPLLVLSLISVALKLRPRGQG